MSKKMFWILVAVAAVALLTVHIVMKINHPDADVPLSKTLAIHIGAISVSLVVLWIIWKKFVK